jgi:hypothetical protein
VLLIAQPAMILAFGVTPQPEPGILPANVVHIFGAVVPVDRFILTGLVIVAAAGLAALYKWTRFGLATRAAAENERVTPRYAGRCGPGTAASTSTGRPAGTSPPGRAVAGPPTGPVMCVAGGS